jgi:hypothetical protein
MILLSVPLAGSQLSSDALCLPCPAGTFAPSYGLTECLACPIGFFSTTVASKNCSSCWSDEPETCKAITPGGCKRRCNVLRFRANPAATPGDYLCRYSANAPEFLCSIPDPNIKQKISCDYETSLLCQFQQPDGFKSLQLVCWSSM